MSDSKEKKNIDYIVTMHDFFYILKRYKKKIIFCVWVFGFLGFSYAILTPTKYPIKASFKERGMASHVDSTAFSALIGSRSSLSDKQAEATTWMSSKNLLRQLVLNMGLNATIQSNPPHPYLNLLYRIKNNLALEYAYWTKRKTPGIYEIRSDFVLKDVVYDREIPLSLDLVVYPDNTFSINDTRDTYTGVLNEPFKYEDITFTLVSNLKSSLDKETHYTLDFISVEKATKDIAQLIKFDTDPLDKEMVLLEINYPDRFVGTDILNQLMLIYKKNKLKEQKRISLEQITYLKNRQVEAESMLKEMMNTLALEQSKDLLNSGFMTSDKAAEFLAARLQEHQKRLLIIDIDIKRLKNVLSEGYVYYDRYHMESDPAIINNLLTEIRKLSQQADSIKLSLQESKANFDEDELMTFTKQIAEVEDLQGLLLELQDIRNEIKQDNIVEISDSLLNDPRIMLKSWYEKLKEYFVDFKGSLLSNNEWENKKIQFTQYLDNLIQLFEVHHNAIRQRLTNHGDLKEEFMGIDLNIAQELFVHYHRELNKTDSIILKLQWVLDNLYDPKFELNSLMSHLEDSISKNLITNYSAQLFKLQDQKNLSQKEQERIKEELQRQRSFLEMHLKQTMQISKLNIDLLKSKAHGLNKVSLALIQQQISLLEKQLDNFISNRISNLNHESLVIKEEISKITEMMSKIPEKRISEQLIQQKLEQSRDFGREITRLFETKNISHNLEIVQSTPVDRAFPPLFPIYPKIVLYSIIGAFFGALASTTYLFMKEALTGVRASIPNLKAIGMHVSGELSREFTSKNYRYLLDQDLKVLRNIAEKFFDHKHQASLLIGFKNNNLAIELLKLAKKKDLNILFLSLDFSDVKENENEGLLQYLEGKILFPEIKTADFADYIYAGGSTRFSQEILSKPLFTKLLDALKSKYDGIIAYSPLDSVSSEGKSLISSFDNICLYAEDQLLEEVSDSALNGKIRGISKNFTYVF